jgi:hypothetical protein
MIGEQEVEIVFVCYHQAVQSFSLLLNCTRCVKVNFGGVTFGKRVVCCCPCSIKYDSRVCTSNRGRSVFLRNKAELFFDGTFFVRKLLGVRLCHCAILSILNFSLPCSRRR